MNATRLADLVWRSLLRQDVRTGSQCRRENLLRLRQAFQRKPLLFILICFAVVGRTELGVLEPDVERQGVPAMEATTASVCHSNTESTLFACNISVKDTYIGIPGRASRLR